MSPPRKGSTRAGGGGGGASTQRARRRRSSSFSFAPLSLVVVGKEEEEEDTPPHPRRRRSSVSKTKPALETIQSPKLFMKSVLFVVSGIISLLCVMFLFQGMYNSYWFTSLTLYHHALVHPAHMKQLNHLTDSNHGNKKKKTVICMFGNAESRETASFAAVQWPGFFVYMAVWGAEGKSTPEKTHQDQHKEKEKVVKLIDPNGEQHLENLWVIPAAGSSHAGGWELALDFAQRHQRDLGSKCHYFFATDDDVAWGLTSVGYDVVMKMKEEEDTPKKRKIRKKEQQGLEGHAKFPDGEYDMEGRRGITATGDMNEEESTDREGLVLALLASYRPAFVAFNWDFGDTHKPAMIQTGVAWGRRLESQYADVDGVDSVEDKGKVVKGTLLRNGMNDGLVQPLTGFDNGCLIFSAELVRLFTPLWLGKGWKPSFIVQHAFENLIMSTPFLPRGAALRFNGLAYVNPRGQRHPYDAIRTYKTELDNLVHCWRWGEDLLPVDAIPPRWQQMFKRGANQTDAEAALDSHPFDLFQLDRIAHIIDIRSSVIQDQPSLKGSVTPEKMSKTQRAVDVLRAEAGWHVNPCQMVCF
eukprot:Nk52_evm6s263 gene=Nk52_evmTU6s263